MEERNNNASTVLLTVLAIATLLVAIVGATFAYFTAVVRGNDTAQSVIVNTAQIGTITYTNGTELRLENAYPGAYSNTVEFTIESSSNTTVPVKYMLYWDYVTNTFTNTSDLVYSIQGTQNGSGSTVNITKVAPTDEEVRISIGQGQIYPGETHTYRMQVHYKETASSQNADQGKKFVGVIQVSTGGVYYTDSAKEGQTTIPSPY